MQFRICPKLEFCHPERSEREVEEPARRRMRKGSRSLQRYSYPQKEFLELPLPGLTRYGSEKSELPDIYRCSSIYYIDIRRYTKPSYPSPQPQESPAPPCRL